MAGIPNFRFRLPSRNWLIFLSVTGSFTTALLYDRYHKRKAQRRWCKVVSHLAEEPLPTTQMPRTITIFLSAPPGDGLRAAREHFHEYVKPILVAGALDWEVIEGRREGEVRASLASKIRRIRRRNGERTGAQDVEETVEDRLEDFRRGAHITNWDGIQGDLILGRHTWKEYVRGLHEGWLGPLDPPVSPNLPSLDPEHPSEPSSVASASLSTPPASGEPLSKSTPNQNSSYLGTIEPESPSAAETPAKEPEKPPDKPPPKTSPLPPYILPAAYATSSLSPETPLTFPPSSVLPFPHLLGFLNTPIRIYRFLNRRHLADDTGRSVAALVLASDTTDFKSGRELLTSADQDEATFPPITQQEIAETPSAWEQEHVLLDEESEWHKTAWAPNAEESPDQERPWKEKMIIDDRIGSRMRAFALTTGEVDERTKEAETGMSAEDSQQSGRIKSLLVWLGLRKEGGPMGWEMGLVGNEDQ